MRRLRASMVPTAAILLLGSSHGPAQADDDSGFSWNRKMLSLTTVPSSEGPSGTHDIVLIWRFEFTGDGAIADLSTDATMTSSSTETVVGNPCIIWDITDSCSHACVSDSCGTALIDAVETTLSCGASEPLCRGPELTGVFPAIPLAPGTEITVAVSPTAGAAPEIDTSDDSITIIFGPTSVNPDSWTRIKGIYR